MPAMPAINTVTRMSPWPRSTMPGSTAGPEEDAVDVDAEHLAVRLVGHVGERDDRRVTEDLPVRDDACVQQHEVERGQRGEECVPRRRVADVELQLVRRTGVQIGDEDRGALGPEPLDAGLADAVRAARHERRPSTAHAGPPRPVQSRTPCTMDADVHAGVYICQCRRSSRSIARHGSGSRGPSAGRRLDPSGRRCVRRRRVRRRLDGGRRTGRRRRG